MSETLPLLTTSFNASLSVETRPERLTDDAGAILYRTRFPGQVVALCGAPESLFGVVQVRVTPKTLRDPLILYCLPPVLRLP